MRQLVIVSVLAFSATASADRLINMPTARKIPFRAMKFEVRMETRRDGESEYYLGAGASRNLELELRTRNFGTGAHVGTFDLTYNFVAPITGFTPGFAIGVQDALDRTPTGRRPFFVVTFREGFYAIGGEQPADLTMGVSFVRRRAYLMVGASVPFSNAFRVMGEHDGLGLAAGVEIRPARTLGLQFLVRDGKPWAGLTLNHRF